MENFNIDEPREIGKKKDRLSSREKNMIKVMRVEELLKKKFFNEASLSIPNYKSNIGHFSAKKLLKFRDFLSKHKLMQLRDFIIFSHGGRFTIHKSSITPKIKKDMEKKFNIKLKLVRENTIKEAPAKFQSVHTTSAFDSTFDKFYARYVPLTTKFMQSILGKERVSVFHVSGREGAKNIGRIVGKKSALSTFTKVDKGEKLAKGKGIQTEGGIVFQLEGSLLVSSTRDMQTHPDKTGRRWVSPYYLAGKVAGDKMQKELEKGVKALKIDRDTWFEIDWELRDKVREKNKGKDWTDLEPIIKKELGLVKRNWIKKYIDLCYKIVSRYKKQIKRHILSQKNKASQFGWNEFIVNQIEVKDVFILERENYKDVRDILEKVATGTLTIGSPAQYRKWFKDRGGIINDSSWRD